MRMAATAFRDMEMLKQNVQQTFAELRAALHMREKLLLRQLDVIANTRAQQMGRGTKGDDLPNETATRRVRFIVEQEEELLASIRAFGRFQVDNMNLALQDVYWRNEDYITPTNDHETMFKGLQSDASRVTEENGETEEQPQAIVVDFSHNKALMQKSVKRMNESIINITLQEAKELIGQAKLYREPSVPPLNLEELDDELESSIAEAISSLGGGGAISEAVVKTPENTKYSQTQQQTKTKRFKPKITINNCNGTINLRNIASLTINCAPEEAITAQLPLHCNGRRGEHGGKEGKHNEDETSNSVQSAKSTKLTEKTKTHIHNEVSNYSSSTTECNSPSSTANSSNQSSNASSRSQSKKQKISKKASKSEKNVPNLTVSSSATNNTTNNTQATTTTGSGVGVYDYDLVDGGDRATTEVTCDFYNRLLNEIKKSITQSQRIRAQAGMSATAGADSTYGDNSNLAPTTSSTSDSQTPPDKRLILKNFENLKIVLEANNGGNEETFHPVQIEQWLAEIISETDLEPMQNTDILEHSKIQNPELDTRPK